MSERMGDLGVIAMHYGERIPCDEICKEFVQQNPRRLFNFLWIKFVNLLHLSDLYVIISIIIKLVIHRHTIKFVF